MFEHKTAPLVSRPVFFYRVWKSLVFAISILIGSLGIGMAGYHWLCHLSWLDSYVNASMILTGMGPVAVIQSTIGKLFAGTYAIFSGVAFLTMASVILGPFFHRFMHKFHVDS